ncbi:flagellar protein FlgN [Novosphingobium sp. KA1]|uniref:flagellar protein FlgN n=1 Tax=Novosphingobium sp. (strain KA1) TaxID=164608 RepID=UPI001AF7CDF3|nr:flagellar protein FlgN [Novosphingobium sp. KA1]QSR16559.1 flagellar protein FlgN [Novosphingobium sp. KA1]
MTQSDISLAPPPELHEALRQMLAVLECERQALAGLDLDAIVGVTQAKDRLCGTLDSAGIIELDEECRGMLETARRLNEVNRQVRNIIAANVAKRLDVLTGTSRLYRAGASYTLTGAAIVTGRG